MPFRTMSLLLPPLWDPTGWTRCGMCWEGPRLGEPTGKSAGFTRLKPVLKFPFPGFKLRPSNVAPCGRGPQICRKGHKFHADIVQNWPFRCMQGSKSLKTREAVLGVIPQAWIKWDPCYRRRSGPCYTTTQAFIEACHSSRAPGQAFPRLLRRL